MYKSKLWIVLALLATTASMQAQTAIVNARRCVDCEEVVGADFRWIEPAAGQWRTWCLTSSDQFRLGPPPQPSVTAQEIREIQRLQSLLDSDARARIAYWDAGASQYRWIQIATAEIARLKLNNVRGTRVMALLNVAIYDATIAAWDSKYAYRRPRPGRFTSDISVLVPDVNSPSYPSEHAVTAGAAAAVLSYLFPDNVAFFEQRAAESADSRVMAGAQYRSDVTAGIELGRKVGAQVIAWAVMDGSDAKWSGTVPTGAGHWNGKNPVEPLAGAWRSWVLHSGNEFRPAPPPAYDSAQETSELAEVKSFTRTFDSNRAAFFWQGMPAFQEATDIVGRELFELRLESDAPRASRAYALTSIANYDTSVACFEAKYAYWAIRPFQLDATVTTLFPTPNHPSYPAAHACNSAAVAEVLSYLFPADATEFHAAASEAANSRLWAGIHFRSDLNAGSALGRAVAQRVIALAKTDGSQ
jgi:membrane-associated phospholipid phosphatase